MRHFWEIVKERMIKMKLGVIYGGKSTESLISITSAFTFLQWIDFKKYSVIPIYINNKGNWNFGKERIEPFEKQGEMIFLSNNEKEFNEKLHNIDLAIPILSGMNGEDGSIQGIFEMFNIPYIGNGIEASALSMNKILTKRFLKSYDIHLVKDISIDILTWETNKKYILDSVSEELKYPVIVKPARLGSSIGISKASNEEELLNAINEGFKYDLDLLIERFIKKTEINVAILQNKDELIISKPGIVISENEFYSYEDKYSVESTAIKKVAKLSDEQNLLLYKYSNEVFNAVKGRGLMRLDFFIDTKGKIILNEINTLPSLGGNSVYPYLLNESGINNEMIVDYLIQSAIDIHQKKQKLYFSYN